MPGQRPTVAVLLGTDHHRFPRLVEWVRRTRVDADWFVQHGHTPLPAGLRGAPLLAVDDLGALLERAAAVVTHGGPGLIMEARAAGHHPVVVPRDPSLGEHVDAHQQRFAARIARDGLIARVDHLADFEAAVAGALGRGRQPVTAAASSIVVTERLATMVADLVATRHRHPRRV